MVPFEIAAIIIGVIVLVVGIVASLLAVFDGSANKVAADAAQTAVEAAKIAVGAAQVADTAATSAASIQGQAAAQGVSLSPQEAAVIEQVVGSSADSPNVTPTVVVQTVEPVEPAAVPNGSIADFWTRFYNQAKQPPTVNILGRPLVSNNSSRECGGCLTVRRKRSRKSSRKSSRKGSRKSSRKSSRIA